jgi:methylphosphotriester-DNA--protein-cysteine methyltransferase
MPVLPNPRHERFAQLIFEGITNGETKPYYQQRAYVAVGYTPKDVGKRTGSAQASSSRLLGRVMQRVRELQAQAAERSQETAQKCVDELNQIKRDAHADKAYSAAVSAVMGKAKILNLITDRIEDVTNVDYNSAQSMNDIGKKLLQSIGFKEPDDVSIAAAVEANDAFVDQLQQIRDRAVATLE